MGVERTEGFKCTSCDNMFEDIDEAVGCCGITVEIEWEVTVRGTSTIACQDTQELEDAKNIDFDDLVEVNIESSNSNADTDVDYIDGSVNCINCEEVIE